MPVASTARASAMKPSSMSVLGEPHVGAVLAVEDQRELLVVADAEDDERGQPLGVDLHAARVHPLAGKLLEDEAAHVLVADPGDHRGS